MRWKWWEVSRNPKGWTGCKRHRKTLWKGLGIESIGRGLGRKVGECKKVKENHRVTISKSDKRDRQLQCVSPCWWHVDSEKKKKSNNSEKVVPDSLLSMSLTAGEKLMHYLVLVISKQCQGTFRENRLASASPPPNPPVLPNPILSIPIPDPHSLPSLLPPFLLSHPTIFSVFLSFIAFV